MQKILVIDGNPLLYQADSILNLTNNHGKRVGGVYGTLRVLQLAVERLSPSMVIVCWDSPTRNLFRTFMYPAYKSNRKPKNEEEIRARRELYKQIDEVKQVLDHMPVLQLRWNGLEGDDLAYWVINHLFTKKQPRKFLLTTIDRDWLQLIRSNVSVFLTDIQEQITLENFQEFSDKSGRLAGVPLEKFVMSKCLRGDKGDGVSGIYGIGAKTAARLVKYETPYRFDAVGFGDERVASNLSLVEFNRLLLDLSCVPYTEDLHKRLREQLTERAIDWVLVKCYLEEQGFVEILSQWKHWKSSFLNLSTEVLV